MRRVERAAEQADAKSIGNGRGGDPFG